jgi:hypothetical protein
MTSILETELVSTLLALFTLWFFTCLRILNTDSNSILLHQQYINHYGNYFLSYDFAVVLLSY